MSTTPVSQTINIADLPARVGTCIPSFVGILDLIWERKEGSKNGKDWSVQSGLLEKGNEKCQVTFWNRGEMSGMKGKTLFLSARMSKGKLTGLDVKEAEYQGKTNIQIHVAGFAGLTGESDKFNATQQAMDGYQADAEGKPPEAAPAPQKPVKSHPEANLPLSGVLVARQRMMQLANMFGMARDAAKYVAKIHGFEGIPEDVRTCSTSLFIQAVREGLDKSMPAHPLVNGKPEPAKQPAPTVDNVPDLEPNDIPWDHEGTEATEPF